MNSKNWIRAFAALAVVACSHDAPAPSRRTPDGGNDATLRSVHLSVQVVADAKIKTGVAAKENLIGALELLGERIVGKDHEVTSFSRASDAIAVLAAGERFDVILTDLMMPEMTGMDPCAAIERAAPDQLGGLVLMTGGAFSPPARDFLDKATYQRIEKPFDVQGLRAVVNGLLK